MKLSGALIVFLCLMTGLPAEVLDKLLIAIDHHVVTELQLDEELRVTALLNKKKIVRDLNTRRAAADRLIEQLLVQREMDLGHYPVPDGQDLQRYIAGIKDTLGGDAQFKRALAQYSLTESVVAEHLANQLTALRFIEYRFRPDVDIPEQEIQSQYQLDAAEWRASHSTPPPALETMRDDIVKRLASQRVDNALDTWLEESRKQVNIVYLDTSLE